MKRSHVLGLLIGLVLLVVGISMIVVGVSSFKEHPPPINIQSQIDKLTQDTKVIDEKLKALDERLTILEMKINQKTDLSNLSYDVGIIKQNLECWNIYFDSISEGQQERYFKDYPNR